MKDNYVIKWLKSYFKGNKINEKDIKPVLYFSLLWNFFESEYFSEDNKLSPSSLISLARSSFNELDSSIIDDNFHYFQNRYAYDADTNTLFENLNLNNRLCDELNSSHKDFCKNIILDDSSILQNKLIVLFLIIHRYRNNLFHGRKHTITLNLYKQQFKIINAFLIEYFNSTANNPLFNKDRF